MKKSDLLKLAVLGISSATMMSSQVYAQGGGSCGAHGSSNGSGTQAHGCSAQTNPYIDQAPALKSDGTANYTSSSSSSLNQQNGGQTNGQKGSQTSQGSHSCGAQKGFNGNGNK